MPLMVAPILLACICDSTGDTVVWLSITYEGRTTAAAVTMPACFASACLPAASLGWKA